MTKLQPVAYVLDAVFFELHPRADLLHLVGRHDAWPCCFTQHNTNTSEAPPLVLGDDQAADALIHSAQLGPKIANNLKVGL